MITDGVGTFIEIGPGRVLSGLVRRIDRGARVVSVSDAEGVGRAIDAIKGEA